METEYKREVRQERGNFHLNYSGKIYGLEKSTDGKGKIAIIGFASFKTEAKIKSLQYEIGISPSKIIIFNFNISLPKPSLIKKEVEKFLPLYDIVLEGNKKYTIIPPNYSEEEINESQGYDFKYCILQRINNLQKDIKNKELNDLFKLNDFTFPIWDVFKPLEEIIAEDFKKIN